MEQSLQDFNAEFLELVKESASENNTSIEEEFTENVIELMADEGTVNCPTELLCENKEASKSDYFKINAFDYSESTGILDLFITNYIDSNESIPNFTKKKLDDSVFCLTRFVSKCLNKEDFSKLDISSSPLELVELIQEEFKNKNLSALRFFIITNGTMPKQQKENYTWEDEYTHSDRTLRCEICLWDMETIHKCNLASKHDGAISVELEAEYQHPIECLELMESDGVKSYLAIIPAIILAKIYKEYKGRLLNQNVRNYLGGRIKVNKGMIETLRNNPGMFFAYNNGISSTATKVDTYTKEDNGKLYISSLRNWQIVNGGQTTNTISIVYATTPECLENVFVATKISEINIEDEKKKGIAISNIARFANTQNTIKESDLSGNIAYMTKLEEYSRTISTPLNASIGSDTKWFFERMRGQYDSAKGYSGKKFVKKNPKEQRFLKTDIAKWEMSWGLLPYIASRGGELCYDYYYKNVLKKKEPEVNEKYFQDLIAKGIIYKSIIKILKQSEVKAYVNIYANYILAMISLKANNRFDLDYVWAHQVIHPDLSKTILEMKEIVAKYIDSLTGKGENPSTKAKNDTFWNAIKLRNIPEIDKILLTNIVSGELSEEEKNKVAKADSIDNDTLQKILVWGKGMKKLSLVERKKIDHYIAKKQSGREIDPRDSITILELYNKSLDLGFKI